MIFRYPALVNLGSADLTDENRQPLQESSDRREVSLELASGKKRKFVKKICKQWTITWDDVAESASKTVDGKGGRNEIRALAQTEGTLAFAIQDGHNSTENYTVFVDSYQETVISRRTDTHRYSCTLSISEQG